jgi:hypothetical protein
MRHQRLAIDQPRKGFEKGRIGHQRKARRVRRARLANGDIGSGGFAHAAPITPRS